MTKQKKQEVAVVDEALMARFNALKPETQEFSGIPRLNVLDDPITNNDGTEIIVPAGSFAVQGKSIAGKDITFRPLLHKLKVLEYKDPDKNDFSLESRSIYFDNYQEDIIDSKGSVACGRKFGKNNGYSEAELKSIKKKCPVFLHVFGLAYFDDEPQLVDFRMSGGKMWEFNKILDKFSNNIESIKLKLSTKKETTYHSVSFEVVEENLKLTADLYDYLDVVCDYVESENASVVQAYDKTHRVTDEEKEIASVFESEDDDD